MKARILFVILFIPVHACLTLMLIQRGFNPPPGGSSAVFRALSTVVLSPVVLPLIMFDPDGDRLPKWLQYLSVPLNSLVWALALLLACAIVRRCQRAQQPH